MRAVGPRLISDQLAGDKRPIPKVSGRTTVLSKDVGKGNRGVYVSHRSLRSPSRSARSSCSGRTGFGLGGGPPRREAGEVNQPSRTASASTAFPNTGPIDSLGGPIPATTLSRSVTRIVSPDAAIRMYSLSRFFSAPIPTVLILLNVTGSCYLVEENQTRRGVLVLGFREPVIEHSGYRTANPCRELSLESRFEPGLPLHSAADLSCHLADWGFRTARWGGNLQR